MDSYALKSVTDLPAPFRSAFNFRYFNSLQSECFSTCYLSDFNMVISAPTGSGKTVLFELCIMRLLSKSITAGGSFNHHIGTLKTVGFLMVLVMTKISVFIILEEVAMIYIAPSKALVQEKLRHWTQKFGSLGINCLELTGDNEYHSVKSMQDADIILTTPEKFDAVTRYRIKDGGLSFFSDISLVLIDEVHLLNDPRGAALEAIVSRIKMLACSHEMKSSPLSLVRFLAVSATIPNINDLGHNRKFTFAAEWLMVPFQGIKKFGEEMRPVKLTTKVFGYTPAKNDFLFEKRLQNYIFVGYHNGELSMKDRNLMEELFLNGDLRIFNKEKGMYMEYERSMILQVHLYENLLGGCEMVESQLLPCVTEHLTAEIVQSTVSDITRAIEWIKCSYLYNPENYSIKGPAGDRIERHLQEICVQKVNELSKYQMVWTDDDGFLLKPLEPGKLMTKYYLKFNTMKHIIEAPANCSVDETLRTICKAEEIAWIQLRRNEKKLLNDINNDKDGRLRFHALDERGKRKKRIQSREEKMFILVNDCLTGDPVVRDLSMTQDTNSVCSNGSRIAKCMKEYFMYKKSYKGALSATLLAKCLHQKLWNDSPYLLKQLPGIGMVTAKALHSMGVTSFDTLSEADPRKIELMTGRKYPFGNHIKESLLLLPPKIEMTLKEGEVQRIGKSKLLVTLTRLSEPVAPSPKKHYADVIIGVEDGNNILFHEKIRLEDFSSPYHATVLYSSPEQGKLTIKADLIFEEIIGIDLHQKVIVTPPLEKDVVPKFRQKEISLYVPKKVRNIKDSYNRASLPASNELMEISSSMPSFKLIDEDSDDNPVAETEDDDCRIITSKTVFDHIREKAKILPVLPMSDSTSSPSLDAFTLIRKRTREMHLVLDNDFEVLEIQGSYRTPQSRMAFQRPQRTEPEREIQIIDEDGQILTFDAEAWNEEDVAATEYYNTKPGKSTEATVSDHARKRPRNSMILDGMKTTDSAQVLTCDAETWNEEDVAVPEYHNTKPEISTEATISDHARKRPRNSMVLDCMKTTDSTQVTKSNAMSHIQKKASLFNVSNNDARLRVSSSDKLRSPSLQKGQLCSLSMAPVKKDKPFLGFQSVFSFL
ncbi:hypothetical protein SASPL_151383 [Salvia splendens]|uniref:DNA 3'-5' helicase n=1 Tax=Salvia splendens TaxID=180675 RepID=A0A8X8Z3C6_SALSN|nr:hypothetical protein SASPL_151383 [Salvia splendens]